MFEKIVLTWKGEKFTVKPKKVMGLIATIEEYITLGQMSQPDKLGNTNIAKAYAAAINYAGGDADADEVYFALFSDGETDINAILGALLSIMIPPNAVQDDEKKPEPEQEEVAEQ